MAIFKIKLLVYQRFPPNNENVMPTCSWQILMGRVGRLDISWQRPGSYWYWINFKKWLEQPKKMIDTYIYITYHYLSRNWRFYLIGVTRFSKHPTTQIPNELCKKHQADLVPAFGSVFGSALGGKCKFPVFFATSSPSDGGFIGRLPNWYRNHQPGTRSQVSSASGGLKKAHSLKEIEVYHPMLMIEPGKTPA